MFQINFDNKKVRYKMDGYILNTALLLIILLFVITIIYCHNAKYEKLCKNILVYNISYKL